MAVKICWNYLLWTLTVILKTEYTFGEREMRMKKKTNNRQYKSCDNYSSYVAKSYLHWKLQTLLKWFHWRILQSWMSSVVFLGTHTEWVLLDLISMLPMSSSVAEGNVLTEAMSRETENPVAYWLETSLQADTNTLWELLPSLSGPKEWGTRIKSVLTSGWTWRNSLSFKAQGFPSCTWGYLEANKANTSSLPKVGPNTCHNNTFWDSDLPKIREFGEMTELLKKGILPALLVAVQSLAFYKLKQDWGALLTPHRVGPSVLHANTGDFPNSFLWGFLICGIHGNHL